MTDSKSSFFRERAKEIKGLECDEGEAAPKTYIHGAVFIKSMRVVKSYDEIQPIIDS